MYLPSSALSLVYMYIPIQQLPHIYRIFRMRKEQISDEQIALDDSRRECSQTEGSAQNPSAPPSTRPAASPQSRSRGKRGHRQSRYQQILGNVPRDTTESAATQSPSAVASVSEDWDTIKQELKKDLQRDFSSFNIRLRDERKKKREELEKLMAERGGTTAPLSRPMDESLIGGGRFNWREPYEPTGAKPSAGFSPNAPFLMQSEAAASFRGGGGRSSQTNSAKAPTFDISKEVWPSLSGKSPEPSEAPPTFDSVEASEASEEDEEGGGVPITLQLPPLNLDEHSIEGVDPDLIESVKQYIPSVEASYSVSGLSVPQVVGLLGGWDKVRELSVSEADKNSGA